MFSLRSLQGSIVMSILIRCLRFHNRIALGHIMKCQWFHNLQFREIQGAYPMNGDSRFLPEMKMAKKLFLELSYWIFSKTRALS
jgi:hypothetical protein